MSLRTSAVALSALLLSTTTVFFVLEMPGSAPSASGSSAHATTLRDTPAEALPFEVVSQQLIDEHRALEAAQLAASDSNRLKALYLGCARDTSSHRMDVDEAVYCQAVADVLMVRHFGGSLDRLLTWWRQQPDNLTLSTDTLGGT